MRGGRSECPTALLCVQLDLGPCFTTIDAFADTLQKRRERDHIVKDKVMSTLGFVSDRHEGDAY